MKRDKYDEHSDVVLEIGKILKRNNNGNEVTPEFLYEVSAYLHRVFPSAPSDDGGAEHARQVVLNINETVHYDKSMPGLEHWTVDVLKSEAELERFAAARLERFRREVDAYGRAHGLDTILGDIDAALEGEKEEEK